MIFNSSKYICIHPIRYLRRELYKGLYYLEDAMFKRGNTPCQKSIECKSKDRLGENERGGGIMEGGRGCKRTGLIAILVSSAHRRKEEAGMEESKGETGQGNHPKPSQWVH
jgi:hypothetical protein